MVIKAEQADVLEKISQTLLNNGIIIIPTDTIYGFSCLPGPAEKRLELIKGRGAGKHFLRLINLDMISSVTEDEIPKKLLSLWPGPLTLIVRGKNNPTEGIRCPDNKFLQSIVEKVGVPVDSTSVNYSGKPAMNDINDIIRTFENDVDLIVDAGTLPPSLSSTIIDITGKYPEIIRHGTLKVDL